ncbi:MAG: hypothetical protein WA208_13970 [Thermoanaerobaculia bacterium]
MKRFVTILVLCLATAAAFAQEKKEEPKKSEEYNTTRDFKQKIFEVKHRPARAIYSSIAQLGSGFKGAALSFSADLSTITVRDFPENIATIEDAIKRLDRPVAPPADIEVKISVLAAANIPPQNVAIPEDLEPVVKQLQSTLRYANYRLIATSSNRTTAGRSLRGSGVADVGSLTGTPAKEMISSFDYQFRDISVVANTDRLTVDVGEFTFNMSGVPVTTAGGEVNHRGLTITTGVSIRDREKVVIGTTTMGDKALIVVVTATVIPPVAK